MPQIYNIYCDESCHLENDKQKVMVMGAVWCPLDKAKLLFQEINSIKEKHKISKKFEIKWTKVSPAKIDFYLELVNFFFDCNDLHFRALVVPDKSKLKHKDFGQDHDSWYYKMYFNMIKAILSPLDIYRIYLDIKDTRSADRINKLHEVLCCNFYDFDMKIIERLQTIHSHEVSLLQLADLLIGAISYVNRGVRGSAAKSEIIEQIKKRSQYSLTKTTLLKEYKFNIFIWQPEEVSQ